MPADPDETIPGEGVISRSQTHPAASGSDPGLGRGDPVGRYTILEIIGRGGMGVVYAAFDPELDRKVAIKLVRVGGSRTTDATAGRARLLREAQAIASLQHPNVIAVHDVGSVGDQVFVAMEFVEGHSLAQWRSEASRSRAEILEVFAQAGQGLAAAHRQALVHRDFKPENALIDTEGRVRVLDFGLARRSGDTEQASTAPLAAIEEEDSLTMTGAIMGTPAYMAPEQHLGVATDARTDQFAFCVALYEALYGARPFAGDNLAALSVSVIEGEVLPAPRDSSVPAWIRRILLRGLAVDPSARYPRMEVLLEELGRDPSARRRRWLLGLAAASPLVVGGWLYASSLESSAALCSGASDQLEGIWDGAVAARGEQAFLASNKPYAAATWDAARTRLDAYATRWVAAHTDACEATQVRGEQSPELMDARMTCLALRRDELAAVTSLLVEPDDTVVIKAANLVQSLPGLDTCSDLSRLGQEPELPDDPASREAVIAARKELAEVYALSVAGRYAAATQRALEIRKTADEIGWGPLRADALYQLARLQDDASDPLEAHATMRSALVIANSARRNRIAAKILTQLVWIEVGRRANYEEAAWMAELARAELAAAGGDPELEAVLEQNLGILAHEQGDYAGAKAAFEGALRLRENMAAPDELKIADLRFNLAAVKLGSGDVQQAETDFLRSLDLAVANVGPDHPDAAYCHNNLSIVRQRLGKLTEARSNAQEALRIWSAALGPEHPEVGAAHNNLGSVLSEMEDYDGAMAQYERAHEIKVASLGAQHPDVFGTLANIAQNHEARGELQLAEEKYRAAHEGMNSALGGSHPMTAEFQIGVGDVLRAKGDLPAAIEMYRAAANALDGSQPDDHPTIVRAKLLTAYCQMQLGEKEQARKLYAQIEPLARRDEYRGRDELLAELDTGLR